MTEGGEDEPVGSVASEAAKLFEALQDWAKESGTEYADATGSAASGAASAFRHVDEHLANGSPECTYCPLCRVISAVRDTSPEVRQHLRTAATSLLEAGAGLLATTVPRPEPAPRESTVEKIDLSDEDWEDD